MMLPPRSRIWIAPLASLLVACTGELDPNLANGPHATPQPAGVLHAQYMTKPGTRAIEAANPTGLLSYYGGQVVSSAKIVQVNWNNNVDPTLKNGFGGFYRAVAKTELI